MSSYLQANQPYHRVDDGIMGGIVGGVMGGATLAAGMHMFGDQGLSALHKMNQNSAISRGLKAETEEVLTKIGKQHGAITKGLDKMSSLNAKAFHGGTKGKIAAYGGSVLAGAVLGGIGDAMI